MLQRTVGVADAELHGRDHHGAPAVVAVHEEAIERKAAGALRASRVQSRRNNLDTNLAPRRAVPKAPMPRPVLPPRTTAAGGNTTHVRPRPPPLTGRGRRRPPWRPVISYGVRGLRVETTDSTGADSAAAAPVRRKDRSEAAMPSCRPGRSSSMPSSAPTPSAAPPRGRVLRDAPTCPKPRAGRVEGAGRPLPAQRTPEAGIDPKSTVRRTERRGRPPRSWRWKRPGHERNPTTRSTSPSGDTGPACSGSRGIRSRRAPDSVPDGRQRLLELGVVRGGESYELTTFPVKVDDGRVYLELIMNTSRSVERHLVLRAQLVPLGVRTEVREHLVAMGAVHGRPASRSAYSDCRGSARTRRSRRHASRTAPPRPRGSAGADCRCRPCRPSRARPCTCGSRSSASRRLRSWRTPSRGRRPARRAAAHRPGRRPSR